VPARNVSSGVGGAAGGPSFLTASRSCFDAAGVRSVAAFSVHCCPAHGGAPEAEREQQPDDEVELLENFGEFPRSTDQGDRTPAPTTKHRAREYLSAAERTRVSLKRHGRH
jgi:hypothetical protein